ncbi:MAG: hypothetical protein ACRDJC_27130 [Thermomicrobiales bacterium]
MSDNAFAAIARRAASAVDRRVALTVSGAMALLVATRPLTAEAGKAARKAKKKCKRQVGQCLAFLTERCDAISNTPEEVEECLALSSPCCDLFATCRGVSAVDCFAAAAQASARRAIPTLEARPR